MAPGTTVGFAPVGITRIVGPPSHLLGGLGQVRIALGMSRWQVGQVPVQVMVAGRGVAVDQSVASPGRPMAAGRRRAHRPRPRRRSGGPPDRVTGGRAHPPDLRLRGTDRRDHDPVATDARSTVLFAYPATSTPGVPTDLTGAQIPGSAGCTLESRRFRAAWPRFQAAGIAVRGVSTQSPQEQAAFAPAENLPFPSLSDVQFQLAAAPRLPTLRAGQNLRLKRLILVVGPDRTGRYSTHCSPSATSPPPSRMPWPSPTRTTATFPDDWIMQAD
ncbi:redoxin domain-containing protein [Streptomyces sp. NPDC002088]|uniref:redoxin domain-containing protein n=1 Tax=Streptomyces sp. NPDC002088 TaxID=3154665 RepID=UPI00331B1DCC